MIFDRPIWAPNVIMVDLPEEKLTTVLPAIMKHIGLDNKIVGINEMSDELELSSRKIIIHQEDYEVYRELPSSSENPSTILLNYKAKIVYYVDADKESGKAAFAHIYDLIEDDYPIICISNNLFAYVHSAIAICEDVKRCKDLHFESTKYMNTDEFLSYKILYQDKQFMVE